MVLTLTSGPNIKCHICCPSLRSDSRDPVPSYLFRLRRHKSITYAKRRRIFAQFSRAKIREILKIKPYANRRRIGDQLRRYLLFFYDPNRRRKRKRMSKSSANSSALKSQKNLLIKFLANHVARIGDSVQRCSFVPHSCTEHVRSCQVHHCPPNLTAAAS